MLRFPLSKSPKPSKSSSAESSPSSGTDKKGPATSHAQVHPLDGLTGGAFSAPTSGERASRIRQWLTGNPTAEQIAEVYKDLANRDKGAARPLKEKLDEIKRSKGQEAAATEWATRAQHLLELPRLNLADALAWQRDAAKAGAPLSREPLAGLKVQLADRVKTIEDLQHRTQVQREAAVLIAQRIDVLSIKPWQEAETALELLRADVAHWQSQASDIAHDANWPSVDGKFAPLLDASRSQLLAVWEAFQAALAIAVKAAADPAAPLPAVPVWADALRSHRHSTGGHAGDQPGASHGDGTPGRNAPGKPRLDPETLKEMRAKSTVAVQEALSKLEHEVTEGHGKATPRVAAELRQTLKEHVRNIDSALEAAAHAALTSAGELEGWQRWRADQIREELLAKAEALQAKPLGGRKQQDALRYLREQWKTSDQGGIPNHALWKRFDDACNEAYKTVEAWLETVKAQSEAVKAERQVLIDAVRAWHESMQTTGNTDWKLHIRALNGFVSQWREAGQLGEKAFAEIQPLWTAAMAEADAALTAARTGSTARRHAMIEEAKTLGAEPQLRIDAVKSLQQHWQHEAQSVPIERRLEQKLWDAFRKPIDDAFQRKTVEREKAAHALGEFDRLVLQAAQALDAANASGDAQQIHAAAKALEAAVSGQAVQQASVDQAAQIAVADAASLQSENNPENADFSASNGAPDQQTPAQAAIERIATDSVADSASAAPESSESPESTEPAVETAAAETPADSAEKVPAKPAPKPVIARRGDDRPGMKKAEPASAGGRGAGGKPGGRDARPGGGSAGGPGGRSTDNKFEPYRPERNDRNDRFDPQRPARPAFDNAPPLPRGPRLGDAAFRAQREAFDNANAALKKLAMQAHGEVLTHLLTAWENRDPALVPSVQDFDKQVAPGVRNQWAEAITKPAGSETPEALLRLEMAAELPTPAEHLSARKLLQLQMLTRRNAATPTETWGADAAKVLAAPFDGSQARRLQNALKVLLKR